MRIVMTGCSGFIGSKLIAFLIEKGHDLILLSRQPKEDEHFWDPEKKQIDPSILEGCDVVINLAGESILGRWNQKKMDLIRKSRVQSTQFLCETLLQQKQLPSLYINASAIGYYGDRKNEQLDETSQPGSGFLSEVCQEWEQIPRMLEEKGVRVVLSRFGLVLGEAGGALKLMLKPFKMGVGGSLGKGDQIMSWIAIDDVLHAIEHVIEHEELSGPINFVSPGAISNLEFTKVFAKLLDKPAPVPIPKFALSMMFGAGAEVFLSSADVKPKRLLESGFIFCCPLIKETLEKYLQLKL